MDWEQVSTFAMRAIRGEIGIDRLTMDATEGLRLVELEVDSPQQGSPFSPG